MRAKTAVLLIPLALAACDPKPAELAACVVADDKLSVAFSDPAKAKGYLVKLGERLKAGEPEAVTEAADLTARLAGCVR